MMPDLGQYAAEVLGSWAISLGLLAGLVIMSFVRARRVRDALRRIEGARDGD